MKLCTVGDCTGLYMQRAPYLNTSLVQGPKMHIAQKDYRRCILLTAAKDERIQLHVGNDIQMNNPPINIAQT